MNKTIESNLSTLLDLVREYGKYVLTTKGANMLVEVGGHKYVCANYAEVPGIEDEIAAAHKVFLQRSAHTTLVEEPNGLCSIRSKTEGVRLVFEPPRVVAMQPSAKGDGLSVYLDTGNVVWAPVPNPADLQLILEAWAAR